MNSPAIDIAACFREAWRGFKGWWIPLCILSAFIMIANQPRLVRWLVRDEARVAQPYVDAYNSFRHTLAGDPTRMFDAFDDFAYASVSHTNEPETKAALARLGIKVCEIVAALFIVLCVLEVAVVIISKASVQQRREDVTIKRDFRHGTQISLSYILLALVKMAPFSLFLVPLPLALVADPLIALACAVLMLPIGVLAGVYLYLRLFFCSFIITDGSANPFAAMRQSWRMTRGNTPAVFVIFVSMLALDVVAVVTIIGAIPVNSFNYTLRAAAYRQVKSGHRAGEAGCCN